MKRVAFAVVWIVGAAAISFGGAGVVAALDHQPGSAARPELTWARDVEVRAVLDAASGELTEIAKEVDALSVQGRGALAALTARDFDVLEDAMTAGTVIVTDIRARATSLSGRLTDLDGFDRFADLSLAPETQARHARLLEAIDSTDGLGLAWARLTSGGLAAARLSDLLQAHDTHITAAIEAGRAGDSDTALARIDEATAALDDAGALRNRLANTVDVATLDEWLRRNRDYDVALRRLYELSAESPNRVTPELRQAIRAEEAARADLPRTTSGLTIVMADIARGGLNQAVIAIEEARGRLAAATGAVAQ